MYAIRKLVACILPRAVANVFFTWRAMSLDRFVNMPKSRVVEKLLIGAFLRLNQKLWRFFPPKLTQLPPVRAYGSWLSTLGRRRPIRRSYFYTSFFRNRPLLELARRIADQKSKGSCLKVSVLGCSIGAEVYSLLWTIRAKRPDLNVVTNAVDRSNEVLEFAQIGIYEAERSEFTDAPILASLTTQEILGMFDMDGNQLRMKPWLREGITWRVGDAADPRLGRIIGQQDMVFANNLLCHMYPSNAERCLRNILELVTPGGYLFVSGIDLDVRTRMARAFGLEPVIDLIEDIHNGDRRLIADWPFKYWGLEPFNNRRDDWRLRYSSVFRVMRHDSDDDASLNTTDRW
jgi:SAM-dependent methyltransferase